VALAQTQTPDLFYVDNRPDNANFTTNAALVTKDCDHIARITWTPGRPSCASTRVWLTTASCGTEPGSNDKSLSVSGNSAAITIRDLPLFQATDGGTALGCPQPATQAYTVCGNYKVTDSFLQCNSFQTINPATIKYKGLPPPPPTLTEVLSQDTALTVRATTNDADTVNIHVYIRVADAGTDFPPNPVGDFTPDQTGVKVSGLVNGVTYDVETKAEDGAGTPGNFSDPSNILQGTPVASYGFFDKYKQLGGEDTGGCASVPGGLILLAAPALWVAWLMRRRPS
jgi:uncharacterized protein (TIGR03382 family)